MRWTTAAGLAGLLALAPIAGRAQGGPPLITDDPGTPGPGHWEINTAWTIEHRPGETRQETPLVDANYGVGEHLQLKYEASWLQTPDGAGLSNSLVGVKWRFLDADRNGLDLSTYPQFEFRNPGSSSARRGLSADENSFLLPIEAARDFGPVAVNVDAGHVFHSRSPDEWFFGCAVSHEIVKGRELAAELHAEADASGEIREIAANLGARLHCTDHGTLLVAVGRELSNRTEARASLLSYLGWQATF